MKGQSIIRKRIIRRALPVLLALLALSVAGIVAAHPLGNFTISRYSALTLRAAAVDMLYIIDMAEIPTFQERQAMDADGDGTASAAEEDAWVEQTIADLAANLRLTVDGAAVALSPTSHALSFPPGQGNLETLRLEISLSAALPAVDGDAPRALAYEDGNFAGRPGWQEVIATAADGSLLDSSVPAADLSDQLRNYPADLLTAPSAVNRAEMRYAPMGGATTGDRQPTTMGGQQAAAAANRFGQDEFANLLNRTLDTPGALPAVLLLAVALGAAHALTPGHGKTIVGAYLVGSRGKARHAVFLGLITTITHTAGVFALGFLVLAASEFILPEKLYPWLGVLSGLLVVFIGASILRGHLRNQLALRRGLAGADEQYHFHFGKGHSHGPDDHHHGPHSHDHHDHGHAHAHGRQQATSGVQRATSSANAAVTMAPARSLAFAGAMQPAAVAPSPLVAHDHDHDHDHGHDHGHTHDHEHQAGQSPLPTDRAAEPLSRRNLLALGISGGILPCPSALILMLSAIALHQVGLGIVLIVAFSVGLAGVLTGIGLFMVYAGQLLERLPIRHTAMTTRLLPIASATFITVAGLLITLKALGEAGVI